MNDAKAEIERLLNLDVLRGQRMRHRLHPKMELIFRQWVGKVGDDFIVGVSQPGQGLVFRTTLGEWCGYDRCEIGEIYEKYANGRATKVIL